MIKNRNYGITLLELLLVLGIGIAVLMSALRFVRYHQYEVFLEQQREAITLTFLLMNHYYFNHCHNDLSLITLTNLKDWATQTQGIFTAPQLAMIPSNFSVQYLETQVGVPEPHKIDRFVLSANYANLNVTQVQQLAGELNADNTTNPLVWTRMPKQFVFKEGADRSLWIASMNMQSKVASSDPTYTSVCPQ